MFDVLDHTILGVVGGSRSYGTHTPSSDVDIKGVCIPPMREYRLGILDHFEQADSPEHLKGFLSLLSEEEYKATVADCQRKGKEILSVDGAIYDIQKYFRLALNANPNILEVLFVEPEHIRKITPAGQELIDNRYLFLSKKVVWSYQGYAYSQMKRIKSHRNWLLNPPSAAPKRSDFGLPQDRSLISSDEQNAFLWLLAEVLRGKVSEFRLSRQTKEELQENVDLFGCIKSRVPDHAWPTIQNLTGVTEGFIQTMHAERSYKTALDQWKSYLNWKKNRNSDRAKLESKYGFDLKHASHLARLMIQGIQILREGTLTVDLRKTDKYQFITDLRNGAFSFDTLEGWFEDKISEMKDCELKSQLPKKPERTKANELLIELQQSAR